MNDDVLERGEHAARLSLEYSERQGSEEAAEHLHHERGEAGPREAVVECLVGSRRLVLGVEFTQEVGQRLDLGPRQRSDDHERGKGERE